MMPSLIKAFLSSLLLLAAMTPLHVAAILGPYTSGPKKGSMMPLPRFFPRQGSASVPIAAAGADEQAGFVCEHAFWGGKCTILSYNFGSGECAQLDGKASAAGPDAGFICTFFKNALCSDVDGKSSITLTHPGSPNLLDTEKGDFNDALLSYQCFKQG
ncbi:hypothetical protein CC80DRAFT_96887 [Byssothecium circinans]|uniref:Uncharacterized protein n=1 Tax=Byssothecium circinans TaxID=147558 RepID=A0A6A5UCT9_9PLEO|nr:hypothetical protein CC80DRAFT_96887 [Byssothecium circinans]